MVFAVLGGRYSSAPSLPSGLSLWPSMEAVVLRTEGIKLFQVILRCPALLPPPSPWPARAWVYTSGYEPLIVSKPP